MPHNHALEKPHGWRSTIRSLDVASRGRLVGCGVEPPRLLLLGVLGSHRELSRRLVVHVALGQSRLDAGAIPVTDARRRAARLAELALAEAGRTGLRHHRG